MNQNPNDEYLNIIYDSKKRPFTDYPRSLAKYISKRVTLKPGDRLLDAGCGRGEFLQGFIDCGAEGYGTDLSTNAGSCCPNAIFKQADIENYGLPFEDNYFDFVFSKSVIEHFHYPERFIKEIHRVLKPGGIVVTMCPDWETNFKIYFEDYTHRTPFMLTSLHDIHEIHGFKNIHAEKFIQLPVLWGAMRFLKPLAHVTRMLPIAFLKKNSKWVRFSKEVMLLSIAQK